MLVKATRLEKHHSFRPCSRSAAVIETSRISRIQQIDYSSEYPDISRIVKVWFDDGEAWILEGVVDDFIDTSSDGTEGRQ